MIQRRGKKTKLDGPKIDYSIFAIAKTRSIAAEKIEKDAAFDAKLAKAYREVELRDDDRCRVTGAQLFASTSNDKQRREHNHLGRRSTYPSLRTAVKNIFLVSTFVHQFLTNNELLIVGTNANRDLKFFWNPRIFKPGMRVPFRIPAAVRYEPGKAAAA